MTPPPAPGQKKKMSALGWIAIGCGAIAVLCILAFGGAALFVKHKVDKMGKNPTLAAAELMVRANPELEVVESDSDKGTLTIKNSKTGEVVTMNARTSRKASSPSRPRKGPPPWTAPPRERAARSR
jgi:hypothetical protein